MKQVKTKSSQGLGMTKPRKNIVVLIFIFLLISIAVVGVFFGLRTVFQTEDYYVLNQNVSARTKVTPDMMAPITVNKGGAPQNAISLAQVRDGEVYTKVPLYVGDILTRSNTGISLDTSTGIPDDWVVTSLNILSSKAVGGQVARGDYFDIIGVSDQGAKYIATSVLALDVNYSTVSTTNDTGQQSLNDEIQYIIGAPPAEAAAIASATDGNMYSSLRIVMSPRSVSYKERELENLEGVFQASLDVPIMDLYEGTDSSFTTVLRDNNGRPVNYTFCEEGVIQPAELCQKLPPREESKNEPSQEESNITPTNPDDLDEIAPVEQEETQQEESSFEGNQEESYQEYEGEENQNEFNDENDSEDVYTP